jgi:hypothetical protein
MKDISSYISFLLDDVPCEVALNNGVYQITLLANNSDHKSFDELLPYIMEHKMMEVKDRIKENFPKNDFMYKVTYRIEKE